MKLLVVADDLGYCHQRDRGIIELLTDGIVDMASFMVTGMSAEHSAPMVEGFVDKIGLHFNITEGKPMSETSKVASLLDQQGIFHNKEEIRKRAVNGEIKGDHVREELTTQIKQFWKLFNRVPIRIDGHQHAHTVQGGKNKHSKPDLKSF